MKKGAIVEVNHPKRRAHYILGHLSLYSGHSWGLVWSLEGAPQRERLNLHCLEVCTSKEGAPNIWYKVMGSGESLGLHHLHCREASELWNREASAPVYNALSFSVSSYSYSLTICSLTSAVGRFSDH